MQSEFPDNKIKNWKEIYIISGNLAILVYHEYKKLEGDLYLFQE